MATLSALTNPILIDLNAGQRRGSSTISYAKISPEELWERRPGSDWVQVDPASVPFITSSTPDFSGTYPVSLRPGEIYEAGIFAADRGPFGDPLLLAHLLVVAIGKHLRESLIVSQDENTGGTWHQHHITTSVPTRLVESAVTVQPIVEDADGFPHAIKPEATSPLTPAPGTGHDAFAVPLRPGNDYHYLGVVVADNGAWDWLDRPFRTRRRSFTVGFPTLHVYNDGDYATVGEARFEFYLTYGVGHGRIETFTRPEDDVDDWGETDRPYALGYAHVGALRSVPDGEQVVWVSAAGWEDDTTETDEAWAGLGVSLPFPTGSGEKASGALLLDAPNVDGTSFHFGVDVQWSVDYDA